MLERPPLSFYLAQSLLIEAEVMRQFMMYDLPYPRLYLPVGVALHLYRPLKDSYLVRKNHGITSASLNPGHPFIEPQ